MDKKKSKNRLEEYVWNCLVSGLGLLVVIGWIAVVVLFEQTQNFLFSLAVVILASFACGTLLGIADELDKIITKNQKADKQHFWQKFGISACMLSIIAALLAPLLINGTISTTETTSSTIPYKTVYEDSDSVAKDETKVSQQGQVGEKEIEYRVFKKIIGGDEVSREKISETVIAEPTDEVILNGTDLVLKIKKSSPNWICDENDECEYIGEEEEYYEDDDYGSGAICTDGWRSYSTGRGTCSRHGGVAQWL